MAGEFCDRLAIMNTNKSPTQKKKKKKQQQKPTQPTSGDNVKKSPPQRFVKVPSQKVPTPATPISATKNMSGFRPSFGSPAHDGMQQGEMVEGM